jgi:hypothetical protein
MHPVLTAPLRALPRRILLLMVLVAVNVALVSYGAVPLPGVEVETAGAQTCPTPLSGCGGDTNGSQVSGWAARQHLGSGGGSQVPCTIDWHRGPGGPSHWWPLNPPVQGYYHTTSLPSQRPTPGGWAPTGSTDVTLWCIEAGHSTLPPDETSWEYAIIDIYYDVPPWTPDVFLEEAFALLNAQGPRIHTIPGDGAPGMVGMGTWLMLEPGSWEHLGPVGVTDGAIRVEVWADPVQGGEVVWRTGESGAAGEERCAPQPANPADCSHIYQRSSLGQPAREAAGNQPAYRLTASLDYIGGYAVFLNGVNIGGDANLGGITVASNPYFLPVEEAQAINRTGHN